LLFGITSSGAVKSCPQEGHWTRFPSNCAVHETVNLQNGQEIWKFRGGGAGELVISTTDKNALITSIKLDKAN
jgi:hypothetical protein